MQNVECRSISANGNVFGRRTPTSLVCSTLTHQRAIPRLFARRTESRPCKYANSRSQRRFSSRRPLRIRVQRSTNPTASGPPTPAQAHVPWLRKTEYISRDITQRPSTLESYVLFSNSPPRPGLNSLQKTRLVNSDRHVPRRPNSGHSRPATSNSPL
jgi:hypothetical protein